MGFYLVIGAREEGAVQQKLVVRFENDLITMDGDAFLARQLQKGVVDPLTHEVVRPEDGYVFLLTLSRAFDHPSLIASDIQED